MALERADLAQEGADFVLEKADLRFTMYQISPVRDSGVGRFGIPHVPNQPCLLFWSGLIWELPWSKSALSVTLEHCSQITL